MKMQIKYILSIFFIAARNREVEATAPSLWAEKERTTRSSRLTKNISTHKHIKTQRWA